MQSSTEQQDVIDQATSKGMLKDRAKITGPSITVQDLSLRLGNTQILKDINVDIQAGTIHCIIGANGGGKTSLIRSILGQMPHTGNIEIDWRDKASTRTIGYVPQQLNFDLTLPVTLNDFLSLATQQRPVFMGAAKAKRAQLTQVLERFGLANRRNTKLGSLSGGERQRTLFAQAFIPEPSLLVLDEPMTGLDVAGGELLLTVVKDFVQRGGTVIWINHDISQVYELADQLTYIDTSVKLNGPPKQALASATAKTLFPTLHFANDSSTTMESSS